MNEWINKYNFSPLQTRRTCLCQRAESHTRSWCWFATARWSSSPASWPTPPSASTSWRCRAAMWSATWTACTTSPRWASFSSTPTTSSGAPSTAWRRTKTSPRKCSFTYSIYVSVYGNSLCMIGPFHSICAKYPMYMLDMYLNLLEIGIWVKIVHFSYAN